MVFTQRLDTLSDRRVRYQIEIGFIPIRSLKVPTNKGRYRSDSVPLIQSLLTGASVKHLETMLAQRMPV